MNGTEPPRKDAIRDASTVVLVRRDATEPRLLMGQRGQGAAFMPSKFVFPGGAVDRDDAAVPLVRPLAPAIGAALGSAGLAAALVNAAVRELWEETGLALAHPAGAVPDSVPEGWQAFFDAGHAPATDALELIFRAITPPGRPRRFDARFFLARAEAVAGDLDDFSGAEDELAHLSWLTLAEARRLDLPFITEIVLAEVEARLAETAPRPVPFFHHADGRSFVTPL